jgi:hypothetical protein
MTCDRLVVFSTTKTDRHDTTEILLNVALNTINLNQTIAKLSFVNARINILKKNLYIVQKISLALLTTNSYLLHMTKFQYIK